MSKKKSLGVPPRKASGSRVAGVPSAKKPTARSSRPSTRSRATARATKLKEGDWCTMRIGQRAWFAERFKDACHDGFEKHVNFVHVFYSHEPPCISSALYPKEPSRELSAKEFIRRAGPLQERKKRESDKLSRQIARALGIGAKPTKEAVRRTGAKRSGAKPGRSRAKATPKKKRA